MCPLARRALSGGPDARRQGLDCGVKTLPWGVAVFSEHAEGVECPSVGGELHVCSALAVTAKNATKILLGSVGYFTILLTGISGIFVNNLPLSFSTALAHSTKPPNAKIPGLFRYFFWARTSGIFVNNPPPKALRSSLRAQGRSARRARPAPPAVRLVCVVRIRE